VRNFRALFGIQRRDTLHVATGLNESSKNSGVFLSEECWSYYEKHKRMSDIQPNGYVFVPLRLL
jgi:hypothetical protein